MGAFILGILVGWFLEWIFLTYWIKGRSTAEHSDCSALRAELSAKNKQISDLKTDLINAKSIVKEKTVPPKIAETTEKQSGASIKEGSVKTSSSSKEQSKVTKKTAVKKVVTPKTRSAKKATPKKSTAKKAVKSTGDDFTKLSGIGPSISATLNKLGISTFQKLSETDDEILRDMLAESGVRMNNNKEVMDTWNEQAALAAKGDFKALKKFQEALKTS